MEENNINPVEPDNNKSDNNIPNNNMPNNNMPNNNMPNNNIPNNNVPNNNIPNNNIPARKPVVHKDNIYTQNIKNNALFFFTGSIIYAAVFTFCLYRCGKGITYPIYETFTLFYFFLGMKKMGFEYKKDCTFYVAALSLLGISNCQTASTAIIVLNYLAILLLTVFLMLHTVYEDKAWNLPKFFLAAIEAFGYFISCIVRPFTDISYYNKNNTEKSKKNKYVLPVILGIIIAIPLVFFVTALLASADVVFGSIIKHLFFNINLSHCFGTLRMFVLSFLCSYAILAALGLKTVNEKTEQRNTHNPITAIIITSALSFVYLIFSFIQVFYLFIGNMQLPNNYTYAEYAREGFFQLLFVCILNLLLVLLCLYLFRENFALKIILTIVSICTYVMIASSALRMIMYINAYNLTFLRIFVLWALAVISVVMIGVTALIYFKKFPFFKYALAVVTVFYIGLSLSHPDYWIAKYNLGVLSKNLPADFNTADYDYTTRRYDFNTENLRYLSKLSCDAAPVILDSEQNPYLLPMLSAKEKIDRGESHISDYGREITWVYEYYTNAERETGKMGIRSFNFSLYRAGKIISGKK